MCVCVWVFFCILKGLKCLQAAGSLGVTGGPGWWIARLMSRPVFGSAAIPLLSWLKAPEVLFFGPLSIRGLGRRKWRELNRNVVI